MKKAITCLLLLAGVVSLTPAFAQQSRRDRRYNNRYAYNYRPYNYGPSRSSVSIVARLPFGAVAVTLGGRPYHYYDGYYYAPRTGGYMMVEPPMGIVVPMLPPNAVYFMMGGRPYYRYENVFYMPSGNNSYQVVAEPKEEEATAKAAEPKSSTGEYEKFVLEGKTYYKKGTKYYKAKLTDDGEILYEEVGETSK